MGWVKFLFLLLQLANRIAMHVQEQNLMRAGEAKAFADMVSLLNVRVDEARAIAADVEKLSDDDLDAMLRGDK